MEPIYMCRKAVCGCMYFWKSHYSDILTTLSNEQNHVENVYVLWNILNEQIEGLYFKKLRFGIP